MLCIFTKRYNVEMQPCFSIKNLTVGFSHLKKKSSEFYVFIHFGKKPNKQTQTKPQTFLQSSGRRKWNYLRKFPVSLLEIFDCAFIQSRCWSNVRGTCWCTET